jgi:hypothetical protein
MSGVNYLVDIVTEKSVLQSKVIFDKFPIKAERLAFMFSGPFGHPEVLYACGNCNHQFEEFSYPSFCFSCGCKFK